jgi:hypothetical protein
MFLQTGVTAKSRNVTGPKPATKPKRRSEDLGWTLRLLGSTQFGISLFRLKLHGLDRGAMAERIQSLTEVLDGESALTQLLDDGSALILVIRFDDGAEAVTKRLSSLIASELRRWPSRVVTELVGVHHRAAEIGHVTDLLAELAHAPCRLIEPGDAARH